LYSPTGDKLPPSIRSMHAECRSAAIAPVPQGCHSTSRVSLTRLVTAVMY
jgi:hypothetical protein